MDASSSWHSEVAFATTCVHNLLVPAKAQHTKGAARDWQTLFAALAQQPWGLEDKDPEATLPL